MSKNNDNSQQNLLEKSRKGISHVIFGRTLVIAALLIIQFYILFSFLFSLVQYVPAFFGSVLVFTALMLLVVLNSRADPTVKLSWSILIAILPLFGSLLYLFVRLELGHRVEQKKYEFTLRDSASYIHQNDEVLLKLEREDKNVYNISRYLHQSGNFPVYSGTDVAYFPLGEDKFQRLLVELEKAEKFIFLEYFIIADSYMWRSILEILERKAAMGVDVRVLYDGTCAFTLLPYGYPKELEARGIRCKMFSPIRPFVSTHYNNRDHRKIVVVDGRVAFTGGVNLDDCYINREVLHGHWKDTAVMLTGEAVQSFTMMFLQMWNSTEKKRVYEPFLIQHGEPVTGSGYVIPYGDSPTDDERVGQMVYLNLLNQAKDYVYIMTPYLIIDQQTVTALCFAAKRGVDVRLILPHIPDKKTVFLMAKNHYPELLEAGVKIFEYTPGFVHAKVFLCDDTQAVVGTINLDYRSLYLHYECAVYLYRVDAIRDIREDFEKTLEKSQEVTLAQAQDRKLFSKLLGAVLKVFAPLM